VSVREKGGELTRPNSTDRSKAGTKDHLLVTADGLPLAAPLTKAHRHGYVLVEPILDGWSRSGDGAGSSTAQTDPDIGLGWY
jgi:hypothetical protein